MLTFAATPWTRFSPAGVSPQTSLQSISQFRTSIRTRALLGRTQPAPVATEPTAKEVVLEYYKRWNARDADAVMEMIADDCVFEDLVFQDPFLGREAIGGYFREIREFLDPEVQFVVDDACMDEVKDGEPGKVGILWHVEVNGIKFPFSRGASFYKVNDDRKISFVRDVVEPALKPGHAALRILTVVTPIVKKLGPRASPEGLKQLPIASGLWWGFYAGYMYYLFFGSSAPGLPVLETPPSILETIFHESVNFFYVNIFFNWAGVALIPPFPEHPVSEAVFNIVNAWSMMWLPIMLTDRKGHTVGESTKWGLWIGTMLLTNVAFIPYMALRAAQPNEQLDPPHELPNFAPYIGGLGALVGVVSAIWFFIGRPEFGGVDGRIDYFAHFFTSDRAFFAFCVDSVFYSLFQATLLRDAPAKYRWLPFFGLAGYLLDPASRRQRS